MANTFTDEQLDGALNQSWNFRDFGREITVGEYLMELLSTLFAEQDGFSGKRPFGNSGWIHDLAPPLIMCGLMDGEINEDGYASGYERGDIVPIMQEVIFHAFGFEVDYDDAEVENEDDNE